MGAAYYSQKERRLSAGTVRGNSAQPVVGRLLPVLGGGTARQSRASRPAGEIMDIETLKDVLKWTAVITVLFWYVALNVLLFSWIGHYFNLIK